MPRSVDQTLCCPSPELTKAKQVRYIRGKEEIFIRNLEGLNKDELKELLQYNRGVALNAGRKLAVAFTEAAVGLVDNFDDGDSDNTTDSDCISDDPEEDGDYVTGYSSVDEDTGSSGDDEYQYTQIDNEYDTSTEDGDDSTFIEDDSDEQTNYSTVDDDGHILLRCFHEFMRKISEHNSASCLIQFMLNKQDGKEDDGPSLIQAMLP